MIVSASYRTDIPAFYGDWFENRREAGFCDVANPYGGKPYRVALRGPDVDGFVFWTRNARPFLPALARLARDGVPFVVQYTITGYPATVDTATPPSAHAVACAREIAECFGPATLVWRYDPILVSSETPLETHADRFARLADDLTGTSDEVVISFANFYRKTKRNLASHAALTWRDPEDTEKAAMVEILERSALLRGMSLTLCTEPNLAGRTGEARPARCIDAERLSRVAGRTVAARTKGNRKGCLCAESRDIGAYDSCAHGCLYCYAVGDHATAKRRLTQRRGTDTAANAF